MVMEALTECKQYFSQLWRILFQQSVWSIETGSFGVNEVSYGGINGL